VGLELAAAFATARDVFGETDEALKQSLSRLMFEGPEEELVLTENAQPALMAVSLAVARVLEKDGGLDLKRQVAFVAGHSLGEYSALAAAHALAIAEAAAQGEVCDAANDNGPGQVVLSGHKSAVERAVEIAAERGSRRSIMLPVSAPFHCALMKPAADEMAEALAEVKLAEPLVPLVANVSAEPVRDTEEIKRLLVAQVTGLVRWRECVLTMKREGVDNLVELGAGRVLTGLAKRIDRELAASSVGTPAEVEAFLKTI